MARTRTERRIAASARHGRWGARAWRRLVADAERGGGEARDGVVRIARAPGHPRGAHARSHVARWWVDTRDPELRRAVLDTGATAPVPPARLVTQALLGRTDGWDAHHATWLPGLLGDEDPGVRESAAAFCGEARGAVLDALWDVDTGPGTPLRDALLANPAPAPYPEVDALWEECGRDGPGPLRDALLRWGRSAAGEPLAAVTALVLGRRGSHAASVLAAALLADHPLAGLAAERTAARGDQAVVDAACELAIRDAELAERCRARGLVPRDPVRRAWLFALTGQDRQRRALDPDGSLFALAYAAAPPDERARARGALLAAGDLDAVRRVVSGERRAHVADMAGEELAYFGERLAERCEWDALWSLVRDVPLESGAALVPLFGGWRPRDEDGRRLFGLYRGVTPESVRAALERFRGGLAARPAKTEFRMPAGIHHLSFSPERSDGRSGGPLLAVSCLDRIVRVLDPRTGETVRRHGGFRSAGRVLLLPDGAVLAGAGEHAGPHRLFRCAPDGGWTVHGVGGPVTSLTRTGDGAGFAAVTTAGELVLGGPDGRDVTVRSLAAFGLDPRLRPRAVVAHPGTPRLAVVDRAVHLLDPAGGPAEILHPAERPVRAAYADADTVAVAERNGAVTFLPAGGGAERAVLRCEGGCAGLATIHRGVAAADIHGGLHLVDADRPGAAAPHVASLPGVTCVVASPSGALVAVGHVYGELTVYDMRLRELGGALGRPLAELLPRHADLAAAAPERPADPDVRALLDLFRAALHHRFRFDVEVGGDVRPAGGEHDIGL
ncbi:hypothetical protein [Actinomadura rifamycini]|uniref:hypothetical protein n=1 Tax=Actinomadura rifamycini TaxID=31962 RepID=UPI0004219FF6|nr:hypothetical protein [Actinomadura rifamycini]